MRLIKLHQPFELRKPPAQPKWSISKLKVFRLCKRKFYWSTILGLRPKATEPPLVIGAINHEGLAKWYNSGCRGMKTIAKQLVEHWAGVLSKSSKFYDQDDYDNLMRSFATVEGMLLGYAQYYDIDKAHWQFNSKSAEANFSVPTSKLGFEFRGRVDWVPCDRKSGKAVIFEHKFLGNPNEAYSERLPLDTEVRGYIWGLRNDPHCKLKPVKVIYNIVRKCKLRKRSAESSEAFRDRIKKDYLKAARYDFYFKRETLTFNPEDLESFERDLVLTNEEYLSHLRTIGRLRFAGPEAWPCHDTICDLYHRNCPYLELCISGLDLGTAHFYEQSTYNRRSQE